MNPKLILCDPKKELCDAWEREFQTHTFGGIEIINGRFEDVEEYDCIVSPGNSFGLMDGGLDRVIIKRFGPDLMARVQEHIMKAYYGQQPVGTSFIVETGAQRHRYLAHTPTMLVPSDISQTDNVYNAMRAMMIAVAQHNAISSNGTVGYQIKSILCTGLGTGTQEGMLGRVPVEKAAQQMALAYYHTCYLPKDLNWNYAKLIYRSLQRVGQ